MKNLILSYKSIPDWTWSMNDVWKMSYVPVVKHVHKLIEIFWKINSKYKLQYIYALINWLYVKSSYLIENIILFV